MDTIKFDNKQAEKYNAGMRSKEMGPRGEGTVKILGAQELKYAKAGNLAEHGRRSQSRIYTIEQTKIRPNSVEISCGNFSHNLPLGARDSVEPGMKILVLQETGDILSKIKGIYPVGENLKEKYVLDIDKKTPSI